MSYAKTLSEKSPKAQVMPKKQTGLNETQNVLKEHCHKGEQTTGEWGNICKSHVVNNLCLDA